MQNGSVISVAAFWKNMYKKGTNLMNTLGESSEEIITWICSRCLESQKNNTFPTNGH